MTAMRRSAGERAVLGRPPMRHNGPDCDDVATNCAGGSSPKSNAGLPPMRSSVARTHAP
jgi:hypothetical protein